MCSVLRSSGKSRLASARRKIRAIWAACMTWRPDACQPNTWRQSAGSLVAIHAPASVLCDAQRADLGSFHTPQSEASSNELRSEEREPPPGALLSPASIREFSRLAQASLSAVPETNPDQSDTSSSSAFFGPPPSRAMVSSRRDIRYRCWESSRRMSSCRVALLTKQVCQPWVSSCRTLDLRVVRCCGRLLHQWAS